MHLFYRKQYSNPLPSIKTKQELTFNVSDDVETRSPSCLSFSTFSSALGVGVGTWPSVRSVVSVLLGVVTPGRLNLAFGKKPH